MIPKEWQKTTIGTHTNLLTGFAFKSKDYTDREEDIRLLRGDNISQGRLRWRDAKRWPPFETKGLERYFLEVGDFVIAMDRTWIPAGLKISEITSDDIPSLLVQRVGRLRAKNGLDQRLLRQLLSTHDFVQYVKSVQTETAVPHISPRDIREFPILLPPPPEQKRIAEILSTWDRAIEATEKLIANSEAQKKALMQQLVSGEMRFPEISAEPWNELNLKDVASIIVSNVDKKTVDDEQPVRLCNYMDVYANDVVHPDLPYMSATATAAQVRKFGLRVGDVLITKDSETPDDIAVPTYVERTADDLVCGYHLAIVRPKKGVSGRFLKYFFENPRTQYYFASRANGATRFGLTIGAIEDAPIQLPPLPEQEKIASAIAGSEREARVLASSLNALLTEKKALMQQLLTGKRRVKLPEKVHA